MELKDKLGIFSNGKNGFAYISFDHMNELILDQGEACLALEIEK